MSSAARTEGWIAALRRFTDERPRGARCDLCAGALAEKHAHLFDPRERRLVCACTACRLLFPSGREGLARVPELSTRLADFQLDDAGWSSIGVPVGVAFFFRRSSDDRIAALYPGAAGTTESLLDLSAWRTLEAANPVLRDLEPDVEALVVNHLDGAREYYRMPIDRCYALAGVMRSQWQGFTGGEAVREAVNRFFLEAAGADA